MAKYGIPYMGSKDKIAEFICRQLPSAENFYDLFGGGFSMTHCMMIHHKNKYKNFHFNEYEPTTVQLIKDAIAGKYNYNNFKPPWVDRKTFFKNKDNCAYTRIIWSFGNNQKGYIFGEEIEEKKKSLHMAVVFNEFDDFAKKTLKLKKFPDNLDITSRRLLCRRIISSRRSERLDLERLQQLQQLERLERLEQLERLQQLERLELTALSYDEVKIKSNSVIYCDPPYIGTAEYTSSFNHLKFYDWCRNQKELVFISEYKMPEDFDVFFSISKRSLLSSDKTVGDKIEKVFVNKSAKVFLNDLGIKTFKNIIYK